MVERGSHRGLSKTELHVGEMVRRFRALRQLSVRTLADKCGFSPSFISQVERGQASPSIASTERIATALGVTLGEFFRAASPSLPAIVRVKDRPVLQSQWSQRQNRDTRAVEPGQQIGILADDIEGGGCQRFSPLYAPNRATCRCFPRNRDFYNWMRRCMCWKEGDAVSIPAGTHHCWKTALANRFRCSL